MTDSFDDNEIAINIERHSARLRQQAKMENPHDAVHAALLERIIKNVVSIILCI